MKFDIKQFSYLQMNEKLKKKYKIYLEDRKRQNMIILLPKHSSSRGTWRVACVLVVLW